MSGIFQFLLAGESKPEPLDLLSETPDQNTSEVIAVTALMHCPYIPVSQFARQNNVREIH
jgi:hypothetical protein